MWDSLSFLLCTRHMVRISDYLSGELSPPDLSFLVRNMGLGDGVDSKSIRSNG